MLGKLKGLLSFRSFMVISAISLAAFIFFLAMAISAPGTEWAMTGMQISFSVTLLTLIFSRIFKREKKVQKGMDAMNSLVPLIAGGLVAMIGTMIVASVLMNTDLGIGSGPVGILFLVIGIEICMVTLMALRSGKQSTNLFISLGFCFIADLIVAWCLDAFMNFDFFTSMSFLLVSMAAVIGILVALGLRLTVGKDYTLEKGFSIFTNSIFIGIVFLVIILAVLVPAAYLIMYSGGEETFSSIINIQNPLFSELLQETGSTAGATGDFFLAMARALSPVDFESLQVDFSAMGAVAVTFWTTILGMGMVGAGGLGITEPQVLSTFILLMVIFGTALLLSPESAVTFQALEKMGHGEFLGKITRKLFVRKKKKELKSEEDQSVTDLSMSNKHEDEEEEE